MDDLAPLPRGIRQPGAPLRSAGSEPAGARDGLESPSSTCDAVTHRGATLHGRNGCAPTDTVGCAPGKPARLNPTAAIDSAPPSARRGILGRIPVRHRVAVSVVATLGAFAALAFVLAGRQGQFSTAMLTAPIWLLLAAAVLHLASLVTRSEAWNFCMRAAGREHTAARRLPRRRGRCARQRAQRTARCAQRGSARCGARRRTTCPRLATLAAAEVPIVAVEMMLAALFMFTLVGPLDLPPWIPLLVIAGMIGALGGLRRVARRRRSGMWLGLAALRELRGRERLVALVVLGVLAQIARNLLVLHAVGVNTSVFNAIAVLIISVSLSPLPLGAGVGATATVLILGAHGLAATAAGGVLLTVTGTAGALCYAAWACGDHALAGVRRRRRLSLPAGA